MEHDAWTDLQSLHDGRTVGRARKTTAVRNDVALRRLEADLEDPPGPREDAILNFLNAARNRLRRIVDNALEEFLPQ